MIKSRKFIAGLALFIASTAFVFTNHTDFDGWADMSGKNPEDVVIPAPEKGERV